MTGKVAPVLQVALIGCGRRGTHVYLPALRAMRDHFRLVALCDRDARRANDLASALGIRGYHDVDELLARERPDVCVISVSAPPSPANGSVLGQCVDSGCPALAETPIALTLEEADEVAAVAARRSVPVEVGENYWRTPLERFKRLLVSAYAGAVHVVYADFVGHGYHGISLIRSYVGWRQRVLRVTGSLRDYQVWEQPAEPAGEIRPVREAWQFGVLEFDGGARGIFSFTTQSYHSPLRPRPWTGVRFLAEKGAGWQDRLTFLDSRGTLRSISAVETVAPVQGVPVLQALSASDPSVPEVWENPLRHYPLRHGDQHSELTVGLQLLSLYRAVVEGREPEYGVGAALYDRRLDLALQDVWQVEATGDGHG